MTALEMLVNPFNSPNTPDTEVRSQCVSNVITAVDKAVEEALRIYKASATGSYKASDLPILTPEQINAVYLRIQNLESPIIRFHYDFAGEFCGDMIQASYDLMKRLGNVRPYLLESYGTCLHHFDSLLGDVTKQRLSVILAGDIEMLGFGAHSCDIKVKGNVGKIDYGIAGCRFIVMGKIDDCKSLACSSEFRYNEVDIMTTDAPSYESMAKTKRANKKIRVHLIDADENILRSDLR